ncbi:MAG: LamG-like jellyroll fold domain-containing protein [Bacteroidota bacterium]
MNMTITLKSFSLIQVALLLPLLGFTQVNLQQGLVLDLPFSGNANDTNVSFLTGQVTNASLIPDRDGNANSAYAFNGIDSYILYPHSEVYNFGPTDPFTISVWLRQAPNQNDLGRGDNDVISKWVAENGGLEPGDPHNGGYPFVFRVHNQSHPDSLHGRAGFARWDGYTSQGGCETGSGISTFDGTDQQDSTFHDNQWHHYLFRKIANNGFLNMWVDGEDYGLQDDDTGDGGNCTSKNISPLILGARQNGTHHFTGAIDDIQIWNRTLNEDEIQAVFGGVNSIERALALNITVQPNPNKGHFLLDSPHAIIESVFLYDLAGRSLPADIIYAQHKVDIHCSFNGIAILKALTSKGTIHQKIVFD